MAEDPMIGFKFHVEIEGIIEGSFTECSGLGVEREVESIKEGGTNDYEHKLPGRLKYKNVVLKRGITSSDALWEWFYENATDKTKFFQVKRHTVSIVQLDLAGEPVRRWNLREAYPVKWTGPDFKTDSNQVAIETLEITHHGIELQK